MKNSKTLLLSTLTATLLLSGCGSETTNQEILTDNNTPPHKVTRVYGNQELSNSTYANVTIDNSKYFFEYGSSEPHVQVYIDNDLDANTGYNMWEDDTLGAEYMLEDNRLYKYTNIGEGTWSWEYISKTGPNDINYYEVKLGFDTFGGSFALQVAAINEDWSRAYISDKKIITNKDNGNGDDIKLTITDDSSNIYFSIKQKDSVKHFLYYIDTDKNKNSGYSTNGAEYLVEDNRLYKYTGDGSDWKWEDKGNVTFEQGSTTKTTLPKSSIASTDNINVKAYGLGSDWAWVNEVDVMSYEVGVVGGEKPFKIKVRTDNRGKTSDTQYEILTIDGGYNYNVDCDDDGVDEATGVTGDYICQYDSAGIYTVSISGVFPQVYNKHEFFITDSSKLLSIEQWGTQVWRSMKDAFYDCKNMTLQAKDAPNLTNVTDMSKMFADAEAFNQDISSWDVSNVTNMSWMFLNAKAFNQDISSWDVSHVTNMRRMFEEAEAFNQNIGSWDVSNVIDISTMFARAKIFNQDISSWDVSNVTNISGMFAYTRAFNQDISSWDVSKITDMRDMFYNTTSFNQDIGSWNVSNVEYMGSMFSYARAFNQDINSWDVSKVKRTGINARGIYYMFEGATNMTEAYKPKF